MCGRFTQKYTWRELIELYRLTQPARNLEPRYNVAPTSTIDAVRVRDGARELVPMRWGLVPSWWKKSLKDVPATFNARGETVAEKPMFRSAFKRTRCTIPAGLLRVANNQWRKAALLLQCFRCAFDRWPLG
jgi:putative SOS response-associated peptidase YedK